MVNGYHLAAEPLFLNSWMVYAGASGGLAIYPLSERESYIPLRTCLMGDDLKEGSGEVKRRSDCLGRMLISDLIKEA